MLEYVITGLLVFIVTVIGFFNWWNRKLQVYWEKRGVHYPNIGYSPFILFQLFKQPMHEMLLAAHKKYGRIHGCFGFREPVLTVSEPELLRDILVKDFPIFNSKRVFETGDEILNKSVGLLKGDDWKRIRTIITPAFTSRRMRQMTHIINEVSNSVVEVLGKKADQGKPADFKSIFAAFTLDIIAKAAFATNIDSLNDPENIFVKHVKQTGVSPSVFRLLALILLPRWMIKKLNFLMQPPFTNFFKKVIMQVIKERKETGKKYDDMLQLLLEAKEELENEKLNEVANSDEREDETDQFGSVTSKKVTQRRNYKKMSEDELIAQCIVFFVVGYHTTAATLSFMAYSLATNPECQQKLTAEIDEVFAKQKELNYDTIRDMKYLDCVLSETLRMYPAAIRFERIACEDYKLGNTGITIEKGTIVGFNIHAMHNDPEFFPNPEKFYPERFLSENANHPQYAYLPFGAGPRNCLGMRFAIMEIKICICHILRNYTLKIDDTTKVPLEMEKFSGILNMTQLSLAVERRKA